MQGYDDNDADGLCEDTCGDGLVFRTECDDGNLNNNDGCSSTCFFEPGFECDSGQPSFCRTLTPLRNKIVSIEKLEGHSVEITFELKNRLSDLPFPVETHQLQPESTRLRLFLVTSDNPYQETEITNVRIVALEQPYSLTLQFDYAFAIEGMDARVVFDYSQTRYLKNTQEIEFAMKGANAALTFTANLATYKTIAIVICVGTILSLVCLVFGLITPKFIGVEFLVTLQLIFYSQLLIVDTDKWPAGFLYLNYLKFASGYNDLFHLTSFRFLGPTSIKYSRLAMRKTICENFNLNFVILLLSVLVFLVIHSIKLFSKKKLAETENGRKEVKKQEQPDFDKLIKELTQKYLFWCKWNDKFFWIVNNLSFWLILPILATVASQLVIDNSLVHIIQPSALTKLLISLGPIMAFLSMFIIFKVFLNNFSNVFLSQGAHKKALLRPEERTYKRLFSIYLLTIGSLVLLGNGIVVFKVPMSVLVLGLQVFYTIALIAIHPYKQSLKVHTITLLINHGLLIAFLVVINFINLIPDMDELLIVMMGYFLTGFCGMLMILTVVRLYFELKYGEELEKKIQKEREKEEERQKKLKQEKLDMMKKKLESEAKKKQNLKELERSRNKYLYENQLKQDEASDLVQWLEKKNWEEEMKEKFYFGKFAEKPLDWMRKNDKESFEKIM
jgi:cysteine-rich repeat protein